MAAFDRGRGIPRNILGIAAVVAVFLMLFGVWLYTDEMTRANLVSTWSSTAPQTSFSPSFVPTQRSNLNQISFSTNGSYPNGSWSNGCRIINSYEKMCFPDVIILGGVKCGSTSIYHWLGLHPLIKHSPRKEINAWVNYGGERSPMLQVAQHHGEKIFQFERVHQRYQDTLPKVPIDSRYLIVEASPIYITMFKHPEAFNIFFPPTQKYIVGVRNPIDRAWSHYVMACFNKGKKFRDIIMGEAKGRIVCGETEADQLLNVGRYAEDLKRWWAHLPRERFFVFRVDDIEENPAEVMEDLTEFLGLPYFDWKSIEDRLKPLNTKKCRTWNIWKECIDGVGLNKEYTEYPPMDPEDLKWMQEYYRPHNKALGELLGHDFSNWDTEFHAQ